jgi:crotonobetainyl-CoA:carnitine CoA-transferase CaiB-like acyl-CoA transferase
VDYETPEGYQEIVEHIKTADVLVEQFRPGEWKDLICRLKR